MADAIPMDAKTLAHVAQYLIGARRAEARRLEEIHAYVTNKIIDIYIPKKATDEYKKLVDQSRFNILPLLVSSLANNFFIDGYRSSQTAPNGRRRPADAKNAPIWDVVWQPNRMDARQAGLFRPALQYGTSYAKVLPGTLNGEKSAVITPRSPRQVTALYEDAFHDEWARYALEVGTTRPRFGPDGVTMVTPVSVYDDNFRYDIDVPSAILATDVYTAQGWSKAYAGEITVDASKARPSAHNLGVVPFVRFADTFGDLDDGPQGVVWPMLPAQRQLNQSTFGLNMAQLYAAFKQRYVTGLAIEEDENGNPKAPFQIAVDRFLQVEDENAKFGEFSETDLSGYLDTRDKTLLYIASVRQIPPHTLVVGNAVSNISAEALAALEAGHQQDIAEHKTCFGESAEQTLRLAGKAAGDDAAWEDTSAQVRWRDTTPRSLAQVADALGKIAQMLGVPPEGLWERIPDVTDQDLDEWKALAKQGDTFGKLDGLLNGNPRVAAASAPASA